MNNHYGFWICPVNSFPTMDANELSSSVSGVI